MSLDETRLRTLIREAARQAFDETRRAHPDESFYAFALYTDEGLMTVMPASNNEEGITRKVEKYGYTGPKKRKDRAYVRWATAEWAYEAAGDDHFQAAYDYLKSPERDDLDADDGYSAFANKLIGAMVESLRELDAEGFFGTGESREKVTLFVSVSDSDGAEGIETESARQLNPPAVATAFAKRFK